MGREKEAYLIKKMNHGFGGNKSYSTSSRSSFRLQIYVFEKDKE